ncbi:hypothetical protein NLG97_g3587 [Lecanicillium saksenae]|uniref:Uncharacterized protein n=1 Tax=Lecanicillium saksenae TaxID=468837 RepID=A0ACC1QZE8_9HYPO|nr:hypothetical protein NLG97_g3587 [Lecanicillium saksenae]
MRSVLRVSAVVGLVVIEAAGFHLRQAGTILPQNTTGEEKSTELIGDLKTLQDDQLTYTGRVIKALLQDSPNTPPEDNATSWVPTPLPSKGSSACRKHTCCIWRHIYKDMAEAMVNPAPSHGCNDLARGAIRLGFHDAGTWSKRTGPYGGADGSIVLTGECELRHDNKGLEPTCLQMRKWFAHYRVYGVGMADLIQTAHNVATNLCTGGPLVRTFVGRKDRYHPSPRGTLPSPDQSAEALIELFRDKTISPHGLVSLLGAHTSAKQRFVDISRAGEALDTSPDIWDTGFYDEVLKQEPSKGVFRLQSDEKLSKHHETAASWQSFTGFQGLFPWLVDYSREYVRLSLLGVNNLNDLIECSSAIVKQSE